MTASSASRARPDAAPSLRVRPLGAVRTLLRSKLVAALGYPHSVDHYLELVSPLWSVDRIRAEVVEVIRETADVVTLVLRPNENFGCLQGRPVRRHHGRGRRRAPHALLLAEQHAARATTA